MPLRFGLDANFFVLFINAVTSGEPQSAVDAQEKVRQLGRIVADEQGHVLQEWRDASGAHAREFVEQWISDALAELHISLVKTTGCTSTRRDLRQRGMPSKDAKRLSIYKDARADVVISEDVDFFEPKEAGWKLCYERAGSLCRHVQRHYGIEIHTHESFLETEFAVG
jgi:hypothetical protein